MTENIYSYISKELYHLYNTTKKISSFAKKGLLPKKVFFKFIGPFYVGLLSVQKINKIFASLQVVLLQLRYVPELVQDDQCPMDLYLHCFNERCSEIDDRSFNTDIVCNTMYKC